jgi:gliding motility-associated lipoprotein GldH
MRTGALFILVGLLLAACDNNRVYEKYQDFDNGYWNVKDKPEFEFSVEDTSQKYNLYGNVRNAVAYPWSRFFMTYSLQDSLGNKLKSGMMNEFLFDPKSGEPFGESGLGDIYDHQFSILKNFQFNHKGKYKMTFEQYMRTDSLQGVLAVGLRVERASTNQ